MKGSIRVCAEGGKIKKRTRTKSETENWRGGAGGNVWCWSSSSSSSPKISDCVAVFFPNSIYPFIYLFLISFHVSRALVFHLPIFRYSFPTPPPCTVYSFFPQAPSNPQQISGINSVPSLSGRLSLSLFPNSPKPSL